MFRKIIAVLAVLTMLTLSAAMTVTASTEKTWYIVSANGKNVNIRSTPEKRSDNLIKTMPYGQEVYVLYHLGNGWSCLAWGGDRDEAYVMTQLTEEQIKTCIDFLTNLDFNPIA